MWGAVALPGQVGTELGPFPAVTDRPWKEPHKEEVGPVRLTPQQCHRNRKHPGGAGEKVGGQVLCLLQPFPSCAVAELGKQEGVPTPLPPVPLWAQLCSQALCARSLGQLVIYRAMPALVSGSAGSPAGHTLHGTHERVQGPAQVTQPVRGGAEMDSLACGGCGATPVWGECRWHTSEAAGQPLGSRGEVLTVNSASTTLGLGDPGKVTGPL